MAKKRKERCRVVKKPKANEMSVYYREDLVGEGGVYKKGARSYSIWVEKYVSGSGYWADDFDTKASAMRHVLKELKSSCHWYARRLAGRRD